jgi:hypothetical protein
MKPVRVLAHTLASKRFARSCAQNEAPVMAAMVAVNELVAALAPAHRLVVLDCLERIATVHKPPSRWFSAGRSN